jgi:hypothetical protein
MKAYVPIPFEKNRKTHDLSYKKPLLSVSTQLQEGFADPNRVQELLLLTWRAASLSTTSSQLFEPTRPPQFEFLGCYVR